METPTTVQTRRLYPDEIASFTGEPSNSDVAVRRISPEIGEGLVALRTFAPGELVFVFSGVASPVVTQYSLQLPNGMHLHDPWVMGKVLHHCDANCTVDMETQTFYALREIRPGDCITMDYAQTEDYLFRVFECRCDADNCRGIVKGRLQ